MPAWMPKGNTIRAAQRFMATAEGAVAPIRADVAANRGALAAMGDFLSGAGAGGAKTVAPAITPAAAAAGGGGGGGAINAAISAASGASSGGGGLAGLIGKAKGFGDLGYAGRMAVAGGAAGGLMSLMSGNSVLGGIAAGAALGGAGGYGLSSNKGIALSGKMGAKVGNFMKSNGALNRYSGGRAKLYANMAGSYASSAALTGAAGVGGALMSPSKSVTSGPYNRIRSTGRPYG